MVLKVDEEKIASGDEADDGHCPTHHEPVDSAAIVRAEIAADACEDRHLQAESPLNASGQDESDSRNPDGDDGGDYLERIHLVNVVDAADAEECHHQEAAAGAEVADIDADHDHAD